MRPRERRGEERKKPRRGRALLSLPAVPDRVEDPLVNLGIAGTVAARWELPTTPRCGTSNLSWTQHGLLPAHQVRPVTKAALRLSGKLALAGPERGPGIRVESRRGECDSPLPLSSRRDRPNPIPLSTVPPSSTDISAVQCRPCATATACQRHGSSWMLLVLLLPFHGVNGGHGCRSPVA